MKPVWNKDTGRFETPPESKAVTAATEPKAYVGIPQTQFDQLAGFASEDGMDLAADTDRGRSAKASKAVALYVAQVVATYIDSRSGE